MKKLLLLSIFSIFLSFIGCVEETTFDDDETINPIPCFQSEDVTNCENDPIPTPSNFMKMALPQDAELNLLNTQPFSIKFSSPIDIDTVYENIVILKDFTPLPKENYLIESEENFLKIYPKNFKWEGGDYLIILKKGIKDLYGINYAQPLPFHFALYRNSLVNKFNETAYPNLFNTEKAISLEQLRVTLNPLTDFITTNLEIKRSNIVFYWNITIKPEYGIYCFQSTQFPGCETSSELPFPSDFLLTEDQNSRHLNIPIDQNGSESTKNLLQQINTIDGWGTTKPFSIDINIDIDPNTLNNESLSVFELTQEGLKEIDIISTFDQNLKKVLIIPNDGVWKESSQYFVIFKDNLKGINGENIIKSTTYSLMSSKFSLIDQNGNSLYSGLDNEKANLLENYRLKLSPMFETVENLGVDNHIMVWSVTTQSITDQLSKIRALMYSENFPVQPEISFSKGIHKALIPGSILPFLSNVFIGIDVEEMLPQYGFDSLNYFYKDISYLIQGSFPSPNFINSETGYFHDNPLNSSIQSEELNFLLTIPDPDETNINCQSKPEDGYPVIIFQHGLFGNYFHMLLLANIFAQNCYAAIAINGVHHGDRQTPGLDSGDQFFTPDLFKSRDNLRQTVIDLFQTKKAITELSKPGVINLIASLGGITLNPDKVGYFGISLGGIIGTLFMGVEKDIDVAVLNVPGGGLTNIMLMSDSEDIKGPIINSLTDMGIEEGTPEFNQFISLAQLILDKADPLAYGKRLIKDPIKLQYGGETFQYTPKNILLQKAVNDEVIDNRTTDDLAEAIGVDGQYFISYEGEDVSHAFTAYNFENSKKAKEDIVNFFNQFLK